MMRERNGLDGERAGDRAHNSREVRGERARIRGQEKDGEVG